MAQHMNNDNIGTLIGEFDLYDYGLPTTKAYLYHKITNGGNDGEKYPENRQYLKIIGFTPNGNMIQYGFIYFMLYEDDGLPISLYIGSYVDEKFRNKGLGDLLMSIYIYYSYENGYELIESSTRQRKLDVLALMHKYGFRVNKPKDYDNGEKIVIVRNNMVVDILKKNTGGLYYRFKTKQAEKIYKQRNSTVSGSYNYLPPQEKKSTPEGYKQLGWVVPGEEYGIINENKNLMEGNLRKSGFSR